MDQNKNGCCSQQANTKTEEQATVAAKDGCGCGNEARGKEQAAVAAQPGETKKAKQSCCC